MKYVIALKHFQTDPHGDHMLNLAYHYGILYQEQHGDMLFFFREELADKRTARFFGDITSAAVDGLRCAEALIAELREP